MNACTHGMPSPKSCVDCMMDGNLPVELPEPITVEYDFVAKIASRCPACNYTIEVGDRIAKLSNDRYVHNQDACLPGGDVDAWETVRGR